MRHLQPQAGTSHLQAPAQDWPLCLHRSRLSLRQTPSFRLKPHHTLRQPSLRPLPWTIHGPFSEFPPDLAPASPAALISCHWLIDSFSTLVYKAFKVVLTAVVFCPHSGLSPPSGRSHVHVSPHQRCLAHSGYPVKSNGVERGHQGVTRSLGRYAPCDGCLYGRHCASRRDVVMDRRPWSLLSRAWEQAELRALRKEAEGLPAAAVLVKCFQSNNHAR